MTPEEFVIKTFAKRDPDCPDGKLGICTPCDVWKLYDMMQEKIEQRDTEISNLENEIIEMNEFDTGCCCGGD